MHCYGRSRRDILGDDPNFFSFGVIFVCMYIRITFLEILGELRLVRYGHKVHTF